MSTEVASERFGNIERWSARDAVEAMIEGQLAAVAAVRPLTGRIADAATQASERLAERGRLIYVGAGTSGRVAVQDGVELYPTYGWPNERLAFLVAGGPKALVESAEGAEDDNMAGTREIEQIALGWNDVVIGVAASGKTPYTIAALEAAQRRRALTIGVVNNPDAPLLEVADYAMVAHTGSEVIAGSTRMKAGTAQKAILNALSTAIMLRLGRVYNGLMVNMVISNEKLRHRGAQIIHQIAGIPLAQARDTLAEAHDNLPLGVLMGFGLDKNQALALLQDNRGHLGASIATLET